jgi:hypothetical protein
VPKHINNINNDTALPCGGPLLDSIFWMLMKIRNHNYWLSIAQVMMLMQNSTRNGKKVIFIEG